MCFIKAIDLIEIADACSLQVTASLPQTRLENVYLDGYKGEGLFLQDESASVEKRQCNIERSTGFYTQLFVQGNTNIATQKLSDFACSKGALNEILRFYYALTSR